MITPDYLRIYISDTKFINDSAEYDRIYRSLPEFRMKKVDSFRNEEVRKQSMTVFALLVLGLKEIGIDVSDEAEWEKLGFSLRTHGKPYFTGRRDIHFSMSHTKGAAMCAISGSSIGCDIEHIRHRMSLYSVARRALTDRELALCMQSPGVTEATDPSALNDPAASLSTAGICIDPRRFYHIWTRKEAYAKYTGEGLQRILTGFDSAEVPAHLYSEDLNDHIWSVCMPAGLYTDYAVKNALKVCSSFSDLA